LHVDAKKIKDIQFDLSDKFNLNITHRIAFEDVLRKNIKGYFVLLPFDEAAEAGFEEYIQFFLSKSRGGVIQIGDVYIYLLPDCPSANKIYPIKGKQLLAIISDHKDAKP
jgi:hypothetical protein